MTAIVIGLQKLLTLSLDRSPAADVIRGTAMTWFEALTEGRRWVESRDAERIAASFRTLVRTSKRWPLPADLLEHLPPTTEQKLSGPSERPVDPPWLVEYMAQFERDKAAREARERDS